MSTIPPSGSVPRSRPPAGHDPLPVWDTVLAAYRSVFADGRLLVARSAAWFGVILAVNLLTWLLAPGTPVPQLAGLIVSVAAYVSLAVAWHRGVILGERPRSAGEALRFGGREWRFLGITLLTVLIVAGPIVLVMLLMPPAADGSVGSSVFLVGALALVWSLFAMSRFAVAFPLVAVDGADSPLRRSWEMTARHWLRILLAVMLAAIPFAVAEQVVGALAAGVAGLFGLVIVLGVLAALSLAQVGVMAALASHVYLHLTAGAAAPPATV